MLHGPWDIPSALKMHGQFDGHLTRPGPIARLQPCTNLAVPPYPPARRYPVIQHFVVQIMAEAIARHYCPVRPFLDATRYEKLPTTGQCITAGFDVFRVLL